MSLLQRRPHEHPRPRPALRRAPLVATALALVVALQATSARADQRTEAKRHFKTGMALIAQKKYSEGIKELERAYEIMPNAVVVYNIAQAQADGGSPELAIKAYKYYLELTGNPEDKADVEKTIHALEEKVAAKRQPEPPPVVAPAKPEGPKEPGPGEPGKAPAGPEAKPPEAAPSMPKKPDAPAGPDVAAPAKDDAYTETVVTASRGKQSPLDSPNSTTIITKQDIRLSGITRIPELLRRVAGMDVMQITGGDTNVSMRGFNSRLSNKLLVLVDGRSVYNDILGSTFWETLTIDVDQIERIEVVRGPGSALYGANAFAGIVNIITIAPGEGKGGVRFGMGDHAQAYGSGWVAGREGDFAYRVSAGYTRYPRWTREISEKRVDLARSDADMNLGSENVRIDARMSYKLNKDNELLFGGGYARVDLDFYGEGPLNDYVLRGDIAEVGVDYKGKNFNAKTYFSRLSVKGGETYQYLGHTLYPTVAEQNVLDAELEYVNDFKTGPLHHDIHVGLGYRLKDIAWNYLESEVPIEHHGSVYLQDAIKIGSKVTFVASGRLDYEPYLQRLVPSPRGSLIIKPTDRQAIRVSGSTAFRAPTYLEAYLNLPIQLSLPGVELISSAKRLDDPNFLVQPEQVTSAEVGYLNQQSDYFEFELNGYYNRVTNLVELATPRTQTLANQVANIGGLNPDTGRYTAAFGGWDNQCATYNVFGGEFGVRTYPTEGLDLFANYALNDTLTQIPKGCPVPEDKRTSMHKFNAGVQLRTKIGFNGEITFHYQSAQLWNEQVATATGIVYQQFPLPAYTLLNGRVGWRFYKDRAEVSATVFNALADVFGPPAQEHPFGNRIGRRVMGFFSYQL